MALLKCSNRTTSKILTELSIKNADLAVRLHLIYKAKLDKIGCTSELKVENDVFTLYFSRFALSLHKETILSGFL